MNIPDGDACVVVGDERLIHKRSERKRREKEEEQ